MWDFQNARATSRTSDILAGKTNTLWATPLSTSALNMIMNESEGIRKQQKKVGMYLQMFMRLVAVLVSSASLCLTAIVGFTIPVEHDLALFPKKLATMPPEDAKIEHATIPSKCLGLSLSKPVDSVVVIKTKTLPSSFAMAVIDPEKDTMVSKFIVDTGLWDVHVLNSLESVARDACQKGGMAIDVGANVGFFTLSLLNMGCTVTAFEMQPGVADLVNFSACLNPGFSDRFKMHVGVVHSDSGTPLRMVDASGGNIGGVGIINNGGVPVPVPTLRIDEEMDLDTPIVVMKLDIEGHEDEALLGMEKLFEKRMVHNIVLEFTPAVMGTRRAAAMLENLYEHGFKNMTVLEFQYPKHYQELRVVPIDTSKEGWALRFSTTIAEGGDSRELSFVDLLFHLE